jgi:LytS/YehU family sensor histidine kinase
VPPSQQPIPPAPEAPPRPQVELQHFPPFEVFGRRAQFNIPIYWIIVSIAHAFRYYRRLQEREQAARDLEAELTNARLEALRNQLHPHFLFNTLHAISTLVHKNPAAADEMIANLSELLRVALDTTTSAEVPLRAELDFLTPYLQIQEVRLGSRLRVERQISAEAMDALVPTLILQPLVENSIRHGIEPSTGGGVIEISAGVENGTLRLAVRDNGPGLPGRTGSTNEGIGLSNTRSRLAALYGHRAQLTLQNAKGGGCLAELRIPLTLGEARS